MVTNAKNSFASLVDTPRVLVEALIERDAVAAAAHLIIEAGRDGDVASGFLEN